MKSIKGKLMAMYMGLVLIVMIVCGTYILVSLQNIELGRARQQMELYTEKISEQVVESYDESDFQKGLEQFGKSGSDTSQIQGSIINTDGDTIATTVSSKEPFEQYKDSVVISALAGTKAFSKEIDSVTSKYLEYASPVFINGVVKYVIFTRMDASGIYNSISQTKRTIVFSVLIAFVMAAIMGYIFANTITGPILSLSSKAKELAKGKLDQMVNVLSDDEIGQLSESFNFMAKELSNTLGEISREKKKMEIILHNMTDGVFLFDKEGNVIHCNDAALDMLGIDKVNGNLNNFIENYGINSGVYIDIMENENTKKVDFWLDGKFINASFSPYLGEKHDYEGVVVVLQDNTEMKRLDDMRKEFVANVSHELRTPLTTVKSYTETLLEGALEDSKTAKEFLDIINNEADRMSFLVRDLLQLSRFDNGQIEFNYSCVNVNEFISENIRQSRIHAENKNQELSFTQTDTPLFVNADRDRITQVLNNIITNAIKYSPEGSKINVWAEEDEDYVRICVKDNGMGISKEDLPRIFERFYRVDKARSRAMGGTGLGLAIAKEIMEKHGGKITAESEMHHGTKMTLWFSKKTNLKKKN
ncbi:MAG: cell wall metabolism sensor histidine kinase WalK [Clostridia bacterium]|jgi:two-component system sensor histidine kinase VicK|nr:cell wall metabolism sensor histidine kinase WalK [Clostridia bacterium]